MALGYDRWVIIIEGEDNEEFLRIEVSLEQGSLGQQLDSLLTGFDAPCKVTLEYKGYR